MSDAQLVHMYYLDPVYIDILHVCMDYVRYSICLCSSSMYSSKGGRQVPPLGIQALQHMILRGIDLGEQGQHQTELPKLKRILNGTVKWIAMIQQQV